MMKGFLIKLIVFTCLFIIAFFGIGIFGSSYIIDKGPYFKLPLDKDIVVMGHSHPQCAINDSLVDNCINLASSAESYLYTFVKAKKILDNNDCKALFVEYTNNQMMKIMDDWLYSSTYISYKYAQYSAIMDFDEQRFLFEKNPSAILNRQSRVIINNYSFLEKAVVAGKRNYFIDNQLGAYKYLTRNNIDSIIRANVGNYDKSCADNLSNDNIYYLRKIVDLCKAKGVKIYFIRSPMNKVLKTEYSDALYMNILKSRFSDVPFLDFKDYPLANDEFADLEHLNYKGAKKFSIYFNHVVKQLGL